MTTIPLEPNPGPGRRLTRQFFRDFAKYVEWTATAARRPGLLKSGAAPAGGGGPYLDPPDVLHLRAIHAIGCGGHLLVAGEPTGLPPIKPLDTQELAPGRHVIYACLAHEKVEFGEIIEEPVPDQARPSRKMHALLRPRIVLEAGSGRLSHRDWLPVARIDRIKQRGVMRTELDQSFRPPIGELGAWGPGNPALRLARTLLDLIQSSENPAAFAELAREARLLQNVANGTDAERAMLQAQRCLLIDGASASPVLPIDPRLVQYVCTPETVSGFLWQLEQELDGSGSKRERFPEVLEIGETKFLRIEGQFVEQDEKWIWRPPRAHLLASLVALYFPDAPSGTVPQIRYWSGDSAPGHFDIARSSGELSHPGTALLMRDLGRGEVDELQITVESERLRQRLLQYLGEGHAVYYC